MTEKKFLVSYRVSHIVNADTPEEAVEKASEWSLDECDIIQPDGVAEIME